MKLLLILLFLLTSAVLHGQDFLEWSEGIELELHDFKGEKPELSEVETLHTAFWVNLELEGRKIKEQVHFNNCISNLFSREYSWIDKLDLSRLRFATKLFHLKEWETREIRKILFESREQVINGSHAQLIDDVRKRFEKIQGEYDRESKNGNELLVQSEWESRILNELATLSQFCKNCDPTD